MSELTVISGPANEPISLDVVKSHIQVIHDLDDPLLQVYVQAARENVEAYIGCALVETTYCQMHDRFPHRHFDGGSGYVASARRYAEHHHAHQSIKLLRSPLVRVQKIEYVDTNGDVQTLLPTPDSWRAKAEFDIGRQIVDTNGKLQEVTAIDENQTPPISGATEPAWATSMDATTADGALTWTNRGDAPSGDFLVSASQPPRITPLFEQTWPLTLGIPDAVKVYFVAGFCTDEDDPAIPALAKVGIMETIATWYRTRESANLSQLPDPVRRVLFSLRVTDYNPTP